jgi:FkbM family methyltransferase
VGDRGGRIWVDLHRTAATKALYANPPDWPHMLVWQRRLKSGDLFLDVGANVGTYSVLCAALGAHVIAFEPARDTAVLLRENSALNGMSIEVIEAAVGSEQGEVGFTSGQDAVNQIDPAGTAKARVVTLDSVIGDRRVAGIKIDVEGFELEVLKGLASALKGRRVDLMQLEWNACANRSPLAAALSDYGYCLWEANDDGCLAEARSSAVGGDLFAAPA